jgi:hypothetical protein
VVLLWRMFPSKSSQFMVHQSSYRSKLQNPRQWQCRHANQLPLPRLVARQWLSSRHVKAATDTQATVEQLLEAVLSARSVPRLYKEDQLPVSRERGRR